ncbi:MAG: HAMP domain-containing protein [Leptospiraceae bacterium]|nr:HAMP domain-containing protein [Leptospiraceae bacterium]MCB1322539.1 HAMP domain-containing protein [Leptospiraceae bacterium]
MLFTRRMSKLKKKLLLYFILISLVSISVSAEIILELGSPVFRDQFMHTLQSEVIRVTGNEQAAERLDRDILFDHVNTFQVRMILLLIVVSLCISGAFYLFTRNIVEPMEELVHATVRIADGDLSVSIPIYSEDEIGQVGILINRMNDHLKDLILHIKDEMTGIEHGMHQLRQVSDELSLAGPSEFQQQVQSRMDPIFNDMRIDFSEMKSILNLYRVFGITELDQHNNRGDLNKELLHNQVQDQNRDKPES